MLSILSIPSYHNMNEAMITKEDLIMTNFVNNTFTLKLTSSCGLMVYIRYSEVNCTFQVMSYVEIAVCKQVFVLESEKQHNRRTMRLAFVNNFKAYGTYKIR